MSNQEEMMEIWVVPFFGQGHLLPSMELCKHLASRNLNTTLILTSNLSSSVPSSFLQSQNPLLQVLLLPEEEFEQPAGQHGPPRHDQMGEALASLVLARSSDPGSGLPNCVVVDVMMSWTREVFSKFRVPVIGFLTSGGCNAAMEYATWKDKVPGELEPGETRLLNGLPEEMALTHADLKRRPHGPPGDGPPPGLGGPSGLPGGGPSPGLGGPPRGPPGGFLPPPPFAGPGQKRAGPPELGHEPPWLEETEGTIALLINTCHELEGPFLEYLNNQVGKPVWGVGPLLPEQYWKSAGSIFHDRDFRSNRRSNVTEEKVVSWLDSKPRGSVLYVSFGSEVGPENEELSQLADALEETNRPFIWVIQPNCGRPGPPPQLMGGEPGSVRPEEGYSPNGLGQRVGDRGLIIQGWAPQLLILSHPSTGGFLSHCGWNSTAEAIGRGVPILVWPIRGDQYFNGGLVVKYLRVGCMISDDMSWTIQKDDIVKGIERLLGDADIKKRVVELSGKFEVGFPKSSLDSLDALKEFIITQKTN